MTDDSELVVDFGALEDGGAKIEEAASRTAYARRFMAANILQYGHSLGGNGPVGKSFGDYYKAADAAAEFVEGLADLMDTHGSKTKDLGALFNQVNDTTISEAGSEGRRG